MPANCPGRGTLRRARRSRSLGNLGDESLPHIQYPEYNFGAIVNGPEEMRKIVRTFLKYGVDSIKINLSGDNFVPSAGATTTWISDDEEVAMAVREAKLRGKRVSVHARSCESIKHGACDTVSRSSTTRAYADEEALDHARGAARTASSSLPVCRHADQAMLNEGEPYGIDRRKARVDGLRGRAGRRHRGACHAMHRRGIRVLPGGDYGFAWAPRTGPERARSGVLRQVPRDDADGGDRRRDPARRRDHDASDELGLVREGYLADLLLVDGDPLADLAILLDPKRGILAVMKDGVFRQGRPRCAAPAPAGRAEGSPGLTPVARSLRDDLLEMALVGVPIASSPSGRLRTTARLFLVTLLNGLTLASLYFIVAAGSLWSSA
jgi:hypothetical protein